MKKLPYILLLTLFIVGLTSCFGDGDDNWDEYREWRETNENWLAEQALKKNTDGSDYYTKLVPVWDEKAYVLIHYFNNRKLTEGNLSPLYTSTVDVKYIGRLYNDEAFDSSYTQTTYGDSIYRTKCNAVIAGWTIALEDMRVGDSCEVIIPYQQGYMASQVGVIPPYSCLKFNMKLVDIPYYETNE